MCVYIAVHASWCVCGSLLCIRDLGALTDLEPWFRVGGLDPETWPVNILQEISHLLLWSSLSRQSCSPQGRLLTSHPAETLTVLRFLLLAKSGGLAPPRNLRSLLRCHWDSFSLPDTGWELLIKQLYLTQRLLAQPCLSEFFLCLFQIWRAAVGRGALGSEIYPQILSGSAG